jgi:hypothetical protein
MKDLMKRRAEELALLDVCRKVLQADQELKRSSPKVQQAARDCAGRLLDIETKLIEETRDGR